ncbi:uncharacterized protein MONOS_4332 [Monocercomonoides exilis]|uniref:uncharacterized protein n=1 Tax=Monocercomonoides exilis TaxID=2049356 RepID=UPI00355ACC1B|nr:hypothetical protein MONOS_4332 [Monocercomonoides exilis]|eukprot:MONOS_4332.1-p1 / transcript=MONOS_4332.1 / gene=MONOS_4332 / organism=Monocercomonoides_exilis_PA203 / gene_product=unspecified product / transcript_product=unspecified product / location=Mono_scaffold00114:7056-9499(-) / protein_length=755 / sequence_SO=supercontig / SO=protein_coding / is_pseudo=false
MLLHVMENSKFCDEHIQVKKNYEKDNIHTQLSFSTNSSFQNLSSEDSQNEHFIENEQPHVVLNNLEFFRCKSENGWGGGCIVCCFNKNDCTVLSDCSFSFCSGHEIVGCLSLSFISSIACSTVNYCLFANNTCEDEDFSDIVGCDAMVIDGEKVFGGKSIFSDCLSTRKSKRCVLRYGISLFLQRDEWIPRGMKTVYVREKERLMEDRSINSFDEEASVGCGITKESPCNLLSEGIQQCGISLPCTLIALQGSIRGDDSLGDLSNQLSIIGAGKELSSIYPRLARGGTFFIHIDSNAALISDISIVYDPSMNSNVDGSLFFINSVDTYDESVATHFSSQYSSADSSQLQRSFTFVKPHSSKTTSELAKSRIHTSLDKSSFTSPQFKSGCNVPLHSTPNRLSTDKFAFILSNVSILTPSDINVSLRNPLFLVISGSISANCLKLSSFISSDSALFSMSPPHSEIANAYNIHFIFANSEIEAYSGSTKPVISLKESEDFSNDPQTELEFINSTFSDCRAAQSSFGGICCVRICSNEKLSVIDCQCHNCVCSETVGKGGCFCVITPSQGENFDLLHIFFKRLSVKGNVAKYGKNIFVQCNSLERQLTASMFRINFDGEEVDWSNSIVGSDSTNAFLDIYELQIKNFYSDTSVCVDGKLGKEVANCGTEIIPCKTLSNGLTHLQMKNIVSNDESLCANLKSPACSPEHFSSRASEADICHLSIMNSVSIGSEITILNAELEGSGANPELLLDAIESLT